MADLIFNTLVPPPYSTSTSPSPVVAQSQSFSILPPCYSLAEEETVPQVRPSQSITHSHLNRLRIMGNNNEREEGQRLNEEEQSSSSSSSSSLAIPQQITKGSSSNIGNLFNKKSIELTMSLSDNLIFVYPNQVGSEDTNGSDESTNEAGKQPHVIVTLTLTVPINATIPSQGIESLQVELMANESLGFPDGPFEYNTLKHVQKQVKEVEQIKKIEPGQTYTFQTILEIPHDVTPYECSKFGRVLPRIRARLRWSKQQQSAKQKTKLFLLNQLKDLTAEQDVWIVSVPRTSNILDYARTHQSAVNGLGPIILHIRTQHLTVGGYMRMGLSLPAPSQEIVIEKVQLFIIQQTRLISRAKHRQETNCKPDKLMFMNIEGEELRKCIGNGETENENSLIGNWVARLPNDQKLRPSTLQGSKDASLRVSHQVEIRITFAKRSVVLQRRMQCPGSSLDRSELEPSTIYSASWPFTLASCACKWRSLKLPMYSESDPLSTDDVLSAVHDWQDKHGLQIGRKKHRHIDAANLSFCSCGIPLDELLNYECEQDNAQQASTLGLMNQEIEAALIRRSSSNDTTQTNQNSLENGIPGTSQSQNQNLTEQDQLCLQLQQKSRQEYCSGAL